MVDDYGISCNDVYPPDLPPTGSTAYNYTIASPSLLGPISQFYSSIPNELTSERRKHARRAAGGACPRCVSLSSKSVDHTHRCVDEAIFLQEGTITVAKRGSFFFPTVLPTATP